jgi:hypothetical protein
MRALATGKWELPPTIVIFIPCVRLNKDATSKGRLETLTILRKVTSKTLGIHAKIQATCYFSITLAALTVAIVALFVKQG